MTDKRATAQDRPYSGEVTDVRQISVLQQHGPYNRLWQPFIAEWQPGYLLVAYGAHLTGKVDMGNIVCAISTDEGNTWEEPVMIFDHRAALGPIRVAYANPVLYHPPDQDVVWCYAMRCPLHYRDSEDSQLCAAYSRDGGRSWQQVELGVDYHGALITCAGVVKLAQYGVTRYLLPVHRNTLRHDPTGDQLQMVLESTNLLEWKLAGYIPQPENCNVFMHEGNIAWGYTDNELKIVMRTSTYGWRGHALEPPTAYGSVSVDGGHTWTPGEPEPALYNTTSKAYFGRDASGNHIYIYSVGPSGERKGLAYKVRAPGGSWSEERVFYDGDNRNSYPTLLEYSPCRFYVVWDSSNNPDIKRTSIRFGKLSLG